MRKIVKYKGIIIIVVFIILVLNSIAYVNTYVSEKYEVQIIGIEKNIDSNKIKTKMNQIKRQRIFLLGFSMLLLGGTAVIISKKDKE